MEKPCCDRCQIRQGVWNEVPLSDRQEDGRKADNKSDIKRIDNEKEV